MIQKRPVSIVMRKHEKTTVLLIELITPVANKIKQSIILRKSFCVKINLCKGIHVLDHFSKSKISTVNKAFTDKHF